jgi:hypothetical protein
MSDDPVDAPPQRQCVWVLLCPCGTRLTGDSEDGIVEVAMAHLLEVHPDLAENYEREHILFMATKFVQ